MFPGLPLGVGKTLQDRPCQAALTTIDHLCLLVGILNDLLCPRVAICSGHHCPLVEILNNLLYPLVEMHRGHPCQPVIRMIYHHLL